MGIRLEQFDGGDVLYIALDPDGVWARSEFPDELITIDYNAQGGAIGVEILGTLAHRGAKALVASLLEASANGEGNAVRDALASLIAA